MMTRHPLCLSLLIGLLATSSFAGDADAMHGIRNRKCTADEETAKMQVFDELRESNTLCSPGNTPSQIEGWTCRKGGDCGKGLYRCNTQYRCSANPPPPPMPAPSVAPQPKPTPSVIPSALPSPRK